MTAEKNTLADELYRVHSEKVRSFALYLLRDRALAEDALSEVFVRVVKNVDKFDGASEAERERLFIIYTRSVCFNIMNKGKKISFVELDEALGTSGVDDEFAASAPELPDELVRKEAADLLAKAVNRLSQPARDIVVLKYYYDMKNTEIASLYGMNPMTVGTILHRALKKLKKFMEDMNYDPFD